MSEKKFKFEIGEHLKNEKRDLIITDRAYMRYNSKHKNKLYKYKCNKCGFDCGKHYNIKSKEFREEFWVSESSLNNNSGCTLCNGNFIISEINNIYNNANWMIDLGVSEYDAKTSTPNSNKKIEVICPECGNKKEKVIKKIYADKSISCKNCSDGKSYPEKFMISVLTQLKVKFETQYSPSYLIPKEGRRYRKYSDFYLKEYDLIIETDGKLGHKDGWTFGGSKKTLEEFIEIDLWKDSQHKKHGLKTIRIDCFESTVDYIRNNILKSELSEIFDLSEIDWSRCGEFALKNLIKEVCKYKMEYCDSTSTEIANKFGLSKKTVINYLKVGTKYGWCNYDPKEEMRKSAEKVHKLISKKVEVTKLETGESLGVFNSIAELVELSNSNIDMFGVEFSTSSISSVCNGRTKSYKGYKFNFVS